MTSSGITFYRAAVVLMESSENRPAMPFHIEVEHLSHFKIYVYVLPACMSAPCACLVHMLSWDWN